MCYDGEAGNRLFIHNCQFFGREVTGMIIEERASTHVYCQKRMFTKEELEAIEHLCVHEQPPYCNAACPLKLDTKAMVAAIAAGDFDKSQNPAAGRTLFRVG